MKTSQTLLSCKLLALAAAFVTASVPALAQVAPNSVPAKQEIVVLSPFQVSAKGDTGFFSKNTMAGTRSSERLINIPQNIQIISEELMLDLAKDNPIETLKYGSSGIVKRTSLLGDMYVRGFRVRGFLMDNIPSGSNYNVPMYDIERMEMVKGPAALLFGQAAATGGLLNFVTMQPSSRKTNMVRTTLGSFDFRRVEANSTGPVGGGVNYRATFATTDSGGPRKFQYFEDRFFSVALGKQINSRNKFTLDYKFYHKDEVLPQIGVNTLGQLLKVPDNFSYTEAWADGPNYGQYLSGVLKTEISSDFYSNIALNFNSMDTDWNRLNTVGVTDSTTGVMRRLYQSVFQNYKASNLLVDFVKSLTTGSIAHKVSFGGISTITHNFGIVDSVNYTTINVNSPVYGSPFPVYTRSVATPGNPAPSYDETLGNQNSLYLQDQLTAFNDRLIFVGGLRYNDFHSAAKNMITKVDTTLDAKQMVKRWGIVYKPTQAASIYYNYSESFIFNTGTLLGRGRDGQLLEPSLGLNKEIGVKIETADGHFFGSIAAFDLSLTKVRILFIQPDGNGGIAQDGAETNKGYEADIGTSFETPLGQLQAILTYYKGDQLNALGIIPDGIANDTWSAYVSQAINVGPLNRYKVGFGMYRKGTVPFGSGAGQLNKFWGPAYTTSTAMVSYEAKTYRLALNLDNVFNKDFIEGGENATWLYTNPGLTWKLSAEYRF